MRVALTHAVELDRGMGRSAYLCPTLECLQLAQKKNRLGRALKTPIPPSVYETLGQRLELPAAMVRDPDKTSSTREGRSP